MRLIQKDATGADVKRWQYFLFGQAFFNDVVDGEFGDVTHTATIGFQQKFSLLADGIVGNKTVGQAMILGFGLVQDNQPEEYYSFPKEPTFDPLSTNAARGEIFGKFQFEAAPLPTNKENIKILGNWEAENIIAVEIPQLKRIKNPHAGDKIRFHEKGEAQLKKLWKDWETAGFLDDILTFDGGFVPRFIRGSRTTLSNHAFGSAFDINAQLNPLGAEPPVLGKGGSVRHMVKIANDNGFYWGGHFSRKDGMHFELAFLR